jgi:hypothetical protein
MSVNRRVNEVRRLTLVTCAVIGIMLAMSPAAQAAGSTVLDPGSTQFGKTYAQWSAAWWQWALSIPVHAPPFSTTVNHPLVDLKGPQCGEGQSGPVWYLGGAFFQSGTPSQTTITRNCSVPSSKALFFPPLNIECSVLEGAANGCPGNTEAQLRADIAPAIAGAANLAADLDGNSIPIGPSFRTKSPVFSFSLPPDDILSFIGEGPFQPGTYSPAVGDGYYVMLAPLSAGSHTVHFHGEITSFNFSLDVTYKLTVT